MSIMTHPTAVVDDGAVIGAGTRIWHFCHVMAGARIGENCTLGQNVFVASEVVIGHGVKIQNNVSLYEGVVCDDDVFLGPSCVFTNVINPRSAVSRKHEYRQTRIGKGATIGANATIVCGVKIGQFAFIGAGAVVTKDVGDFELIIGNPGRPTGWMSRAGQKLIFNDSGEADCIATGEKYVIMNGQVSLERNELR
jgi:UDP-2-acetamido-3-amino-2,3-dideoxy-glucuronate N-acetyltransferase